MLNFLRKRLLQEENDQKKTSECSGDPDCPMCQVSDETMKAFTAQDTNKEVANE